MDPVWDRVDAYFDQHLAADDDALRESLASSAAAGLPAIAVTATQGKMLQILARSCGAHRILEIGTLGGYSAIWMGRALAPGDVLITLEISAAHAAVARRNLDRAGLGDRVQVWTAPAIASLARLTMEKAEPFDFVFIDADKGNGDVYFQAALGLARVGTLIVVDNVVREGAVIDDATTDVNVRGIRRMIELVAREPRVSATVLQTVGSKGYDGFLLARVQAPVDNR